MLILNGLQIAMGDDDTTAAADLIFRTRRVASLPPEPEAGDPISIVRSEQIGSEAATDHIFGYDGRVRCRFRISSDGSEVACQATAEVSDRDIFSLFAEPIMRTVLRRRGLLSFHAAALARDGQAILIMADKGAGKSSLSWALQSGGWRLLADDLARVDAVNGAWSVFPGHRETKLTPEAARAFGHQPQDMPPRFDDAGPPAYAALFDKRLIRPVGEAEAPALAIPLASLFFLNARGPALDAIRCETLAPPAAVRHLIEHSTPDPLEARVTATPGMQRSLGGLATQVRAFTLTLPNALDRLDEATATLNSIVFGDAGCA